MPLTNSATIVSAIQDKAMPPDLSSPGVNKQAITALLETLEKDINDAVEARIDALVNEIILERLNGKKKEDLPTTFDVKGQRWLTDIASDRSSIRVLQMQLEELLKKAEYGSFGVRCVPHCGEVRGSGWLEWQIAVDFQLPEAITG